MTLLGAALAASIGGQQRALALDQTISDCTWATFNTALTAVQDDGGGTLTFNCSGQIDFAATPTISTPVTIDGDGNAVVFDGGDTRRLFTVASSGALTLNGLTLQNGNAADFGAIFNNGGTLEISASIVAENNAPPAANCFISGTINSLGYNLSDDTSCDFTATGDNQAASVNLGSLADNDGPTFTMLPGPSSDAIDNIPVENCDLSTPTDQRGVQRPSGFECDSGAVEVEQIIPDQHLCANRYNGDLRLPRSGACGGTETALTLPEDGPLTLCVNRYNGDVRYSRSGQCGGTEMSHTVIGDDTFAICVNRYNRAIRAPRVAGQCGSTEITETL